MHPAETVVAELESALDRSVRDCLTGGVPLGTLCSGGLDSSLMTALAVRQGDVTACHVAVPDDPAMDEHRQASDVARFLGVRLVTRSIDREAFLHPTFRTSGARS